jgi:hypothetical protein
MEIAKIGAAEYTDKVCRVLKIRICSLTVYLAHAFVKSWICNNYGFRCTQREKRTGVWHTSLPVCALSSIYPYFQSIVELCLLWQSSKRNSLNQHVIVEGAVGYCIGCRELADTWLLTNAALTRLSVGVVALSTAK